jgi:hypothetical protein
MKLKVFFILSIIFLINIQKAVSQDVPLAKFIDTSYHSVVAILRADSAGRTYVTGSGVLIHPNVVLTAGHVSFLTVKGWDFNGSTVGYVSFSNNANEPNNRISFDWLNSVETHPDQFKLILFDVAQKNNQVLIDIGLIFLDRPALNNPLAHLPDPNTLSKISKDDLFVGVGYGYHKEDSIIQRVPGLVDGQRRKWQLSQISLINDLWLKTDCDSVTNLPFIGMFDSGAPLLLNDTLVVGIWVKTEKAPIPCPFSSLAVRVDNPRVLKWIQDCIMIRLGPKSQ